MTSTIMLTLRHLITVAVFAVVFGCASVPPPVQDLETATAALHTARTSGAPQHAVQQWQVAQEKLASANQLLDQNLNAAAGRALQQATVDARLAAAMAQLQMRVAEQQALQEEIDQLQKRIEVMESSTGDPVQE